MTSRSLKERETVFHRARWVLKDPDTIIENGYVAVREGLIQECGGGPVPNGARVRDHGPGVIMPGVINAHTHLELSALKGVLPLGEGFAKWVRVLLMKREALDENALMGGIRSGIGELLDSGCVAAGEISTMGITRELFEASSLSGIWFHEVLGTDTTLPENRPMTDETRKASFAGHAPHTTSPDLLAALKDAANRRGLPFSIHLHESRDEETFIRTGKGTWANLLGDRGIDWSGWGLPSESPVHHAEKIGILDRNTLGVHMILAGKKEIALFAETGARLCICPRSNMNLHGELPDLPALIDAGIPLSLGTDSLASVSSLSIFDEMKFLSGRFREIDPRLILEAATVGGAGALGMEDVFGSLDRGKRARFLYLDCGTAKKENLIPRIVGGDFNNISTAGEDEM